MTTPAEVIALEERAMNAWPALRTAAVGGWLLRSAGGCTKRANSANALAPSIPFDALVREAEAFYAGQGLPAIFRISPVAPPACDAALEARGYTSFDPSLVMVAPLAAGSADPGVHIASTPSHEWLGGIAQANGVTDAHRPVHGAIVRSIAMPTAFATLHDGGCPVGFGLAVCERGMVGLFDVVVAPASRGRGHGRTITRALIAWGREAGGRSAYLQVRSANGVALDLYGGLGFAEAYRYHYRLPPRQER